MKKVLALFTTVFLTSCASTYYDKMVGKSKSQLVEEMGPPTSCSITDNFEVCRFPQNVTQNGVASVQYINFYVDKKNKTVIKWK